MEGIQPSEDKIGSFGGFVIACQDIQDSIDWWTKVIGLEKGYTPPNELYSQWLYINRLPILQLYPVPAEGSPKNTVIAGLNFNCVNLIHWVNKFVRLGVPYKHASQQMGGFNIEKLEVDDPNNLPVNLIFVGYDNHDTPDPKDLTTTATKQKETEDG